MNIKLNSSCKLCTVCEAGNINKTLIPCFIWTKRVHRKLIWRLAETYSFKCDVFDGIIRPVDVELSWHLENW